MRAQDRASPGIRSAFTKPVLLFLILLARHAILPPDSAAIPAAGNLEWFEQPSGLTFKARNWGDEWNHGRETEDGHTILKNPSTGVWEFAVPGADGQLVSSGKGVRVDAPPRESKGARPPRVRPARAPPRGISRSSVRKASPHLSPESLLVVLVSFADRAPVGTTASTWQSRYFGAAASVKDFYEDNSYGQFTFTPAAESHGTSNDGTVGFVALASNHPNCEALSEPNRSTCLQQLAKDAVTAVDPYVNFASFDSNSNGSISTSELHIGIVVAGFEASVSGACTPNIWAHRWSIGGGYGVTDPVLDGKTVASSSGGGAYFMMGEWLRSSTCGSGGYAANIGVAAHEFGHDINLPDLYDTDDSSEGVGNWSVMAGGPWNGVSQPGDCPAHFDTWSKWYEGWITPTEITTLTNITVLPAATNGSCSGANSCPFFQVLSNPGGVDWTFGSASGTGQYFLLENRQKLAGTYDEALPGSGMLIWHIYEPAPYGNSASDPGGCANCNEGGAKLVDLEEADGLNHLDNKTNRGDTGDPWPGSTSNTQFNDASTPNSKLYSGAASSVSAASIAVAGNNITATVSLADATPPTGSIVIDSITAPGPTYATSPGVTLYLTSADNVAVQDVRYSNDGTWDAETFEATSATKAWTLTAGDGLKTVRYQVRDTSGNVSATYSDTITLDTTGPTGTISINAGAAYTNSTSATLSLTCSDSASGCSQMQFSNDNVSYSALESYGASKSWTLTTGDGGKTVYVKFKDAVGNAGAAYSDTITLDTVLPDTSITSQPSNPTSSTTPSLSFTSMDGGNTFQCQLDSGGYSACASPKSYTDVAAGNHTFYVRAIDYAGNTDPTPAAYTWTIDTTPPDTSITDQPTNPTNSTTPSFSFTSSQDGPTFQCQMDTGGYASCASPKSYTGLAPGLHTFYVKATNLAGNTDATPASYSWTIDVTPPDTSITAQPPNPTGSVSAAFSFGTNENGSSFDCRLDGGAFAACASPRSYAALSDGAHTFYARAIDPAGNVDLSPASYTWTVDSGSPDTTVTADPPSPTASTDASFSFTSTEGGSTFQCQLDAGGYSSCSSPKAYASLVAGDHTFEVRATDPAGNTDPTPAKRTWTIYAVASPNPPPTGASNTAAAPQPPSSNSSGSATGSTVGTTSGAGAGSITIGGEASLVSGSSGSSAADSEVGGMMGCASVPWRAQPKGPGSPFLNLFLLTIPILWTRSPRRWGRHAPPRSSQRLRSF